MEACLYKDEQNKAMKSIPKQKKSKLTGRVGRSTKIPCTTEIKPFVTLANKWKPLMSQKASH